MLQPFVVEVASDISSAGAPTAAASFARTSSRSASARSKYADPPRPCSTSKRSCSAIASAVARASGPFVPAFR